MFIIQATGVESFMEFALATFKLLGWSALSESFG
jgi:hypothetical protein